MKKLFEYELRIEDVLKIWPDGSFWMAEIKCEYDSFREMTDYKEICIEYIIEEFGIEPKTEKVKNILKNNYVIKIVKIEWEPSDEEYDEEYVFDYDYDLVKGSWTNEK